MTSYPVKAINQSVDERSLMITHKATQLHDGLRSELSAQLPAVAPTNTRLCALLACGQSPVCAQT